MNDYFRNYCYKLADTYKKDMRAVALDLIETEGLLNQRGIYKGERLDKNYFLSSAGKLSTEYKNESTK